MIQKIWEHLGDDGNRKRLALIGAVIAALVTGVWTLMQTPTPNPVDAQDSGIFHSTDSTDSTEGLSAIRKCANGNSLACKKLMSFANKAAIHCESEVNGKTSFDVGSLKHECLNKASAVKSLVSLAENVIQDCGIMYENFSEKCIGARKVFSESNSDHTLDILERFISPVLE